MPKYKMLSVRPSYDTFTRYTSAWQTQVLNAARRVGLSTSDLF